VALEKQGSPLLFDYFSYVVHLEIHNGRTEMGIINKLVLHGILFISVQATSSNLNDDFITSQPQIINEDSVVARTSGVIGPCEPAHFAETVAAVLQGGARSNITILNVTRIKAGDSFGGLRDDPENLAFPYPIGKLPELCAVKIRVANRTEDPPANYDFGLFLPATTAWKGRILTVGGNAFGGGISWPDMGQVAHYGFAAMSTNNGHNSMLNITTWALNNPGAQLDFGYRAVHGSLVLAKEIVKGYYGVDSLKSYFSGCSTGGRQGLRELGDHYDGFDGLLIGAPMWDVANMMPWISRLAKILVDNGGALTNADFRKLVLEVRNQCSRDTGTDNVPDNIVADPDACAAKLNISRIVCPSGGTDCIQPARAKTIMDAFWGDYRISDGEDGLVSHGYDYGSELSWSQYFSPGFKLNEFDMEYVRNFLGMPMNVSNYTDDIVRLSRAKVAGHTNAPPFDMRPFRRTGGKVIMYHGTADGLIPRKNTVRWYEKMKALSGNITDAQAGEFLRYFEVQGMGHCFAGELLGLPFIPWIFGGAGQATSLLLWPETLRELGAPVEGPFGDGYTNLAFKDNPPKAEHDALQALVEWVEDGRVPEKILAGSYKVDSVSPGLPKLDRVWTRPLCPYPQRARLKANVTEFRVHENWECR
jgi:feruloyl esterase